jgi:hypothetical protein
MLTLPAIAGWPDAAAVWLADGTGTIDPTQYGIAGVLFVVLGGILLRIIAQQRADLLARITAGETQHAADMAAARDALLHERERGDRLEAALAKVNAEGGPRQAQAMDNAMKAVTEAIRELKR